MYKKRPAVRVTAGISLILLSYIIGWPVIGALGVMSLSMGKPRLLVIGGPLLYGLSHVVFLVGMYLAGKDYAAAFLKRVKTILRKRNERTDQRTES